MEHTPPNAKDHAGVPQSHTVKASSLLCKIDNFIKKKNLSILKKIGKGSFGEVYKAVENSTQDLYAIKVEKQGSRLEYEVELYKLLSKTRGIPKIKWFGKIDDSRILIMEFLGPSLDDLYGFCKNQFCLKTVCMVALQIIDRIEFLHSNNIIHRDIKPDNFLIGTKQNKNIIYLIDFGLSKRYVNSQGVHIPYQKKKGFTGSFRYSSIRNHKGIEQSRRDDLESIGYMLIYFLKGRLPWQGLQGQTKEERLHNIYSVKRSTSLEDLCDRLPVEILHYMKYCRLLRFTEQPDYEYLKGLFINIFIRFKFNYDNIFRWNIVARQKKARKRHTAKQRRAAIETSTDGQAVTTPLAQVWKALNQNECT